MRRLGHLLPPRVADSSARRGAGCTRHTVRAAVAPTLYGAWLVLRANQLWAPQPDNDPDGARRTMQRFYALVAGASTTSA